MTWNGRKFKPKIGVCKDCADREIGCHATCERYITAKKEWDEERHRVSVERSKIAEYDAFRFDTVTKRRFDRERKVRMMRKGK
jgi:hypothetical protein